jgi:hypothetical protein
MTTPAPRRGGFVFLDPEQGQVLRVTPFQYNPDSITRNLQPRGGDFGAGDRLESLRLEGPARETLRIDAEFDAVDQAASKSGPASPMGPGLRATLAALESAVTPAGAQLVRQNDLAAQGILEIAPSQAPLSVLVLGPRRVLPVRFLDLEVVEEAYDGELNPIRARVALTMRVLTVDDVGFGHKAGGLYLQYQQGREQLAATIANRPAAVGYPSG